MLVDVIAKLWKFMGSQANLARLVSIVISKYVLVSE